MRAMVLTTVRRPLSLHELPRPDLGPGEVRLAVRACAVCRTDLHVVDGDLHDPKLPLIPGHEIVGVVDALGEGVTQFAVGDRVGVPWLGWTCGECGACNRGDENLCERARFTGYHRDGGFAETAVADARYCFAIPREIEDIAASPLLCAGLIGQRTLRVADDDAHRVGIYGFGAAAHIVTQILRHEGRRTFAFTRPGDERAQAFALRLGAEWAGGSDETPPVPLDAALIFAPIGSLVPIALRAVRPGGAVVCGGIHMSDIPSFPYSILWGERSVHSVANLTRADAETLLALAPVVPIETQTHVYPLERANEALDDLRAGRFDGAAVLVP